MRKNIKWNTETFKKICSERNPNIDYSHVEYVNNQTKVKLICKICEYEYYVFPRTHYYNKTKQCIRCLCRRNNDKIILTHKEFLLKNNEIHGDKFQILSICKSSKDYVKLKCNKCGFISTKRASSHLEGYGCKKCAILSNKQNKPISVDIFEKECKEIHNNKYNYFRDYLGGRKKIKIECKLHNYIFYQNADAHRLKKQGCPKCDLSHGEMFICDYLNRNKIYYEYEKWFPDCRNIFPLRFDFYFPQFNLIIEYDGRQHFEPNNKFKLKSFLQTVNNDFIKNSYCRDNNIILIRIPFYRFKELVNILDDIFKRDYNI